MASSNVRRMEALEILAGLRVNYGYIKEEDLDFLLTIGKVISAKKGTRILSDGQYFNKYAIPIKGVVVSTFVAESGEEKTVDVWPKFKLFALVMSFASMPSILNVDIREDAQIILLDQSQYKEAMFNNRNLLQMYIDRVEECLFLDGQRYMDFISLTPEQRYLSLADKMPWVIDKTLEKDIASFIGISPVSLSRIKKRIKKR